MGWARRLRITLNARAVVVDALIAFLLAAGALVHLRSLTYSAPQALAVALAVISAGAVGFRRQAPALATAVAVAAMVAYQWVTHDQVMLFLPFAVVLCFYTAAAGVRAARDLGVLGALLLLGVAGCASVAENTSGLTPANLGVHAAALVVIPALVGLVVARRSLMTQRLATTTAQLRIEQEIGLYQAALQERTRVARDVHDVVAHGVSVMVIQAAGARLNLATDPVAARSALEVVVESGRVALTELRRVVGMLHAEVDSPGLARVASLVEGFGQEGLVSLSVREPPAILDPAVEVVLYRVIQEALTNVIKHAPRAPAHVELIFGDTTVDVEVANSPTPVPEHSHPGLSSKHGLTGMQERIVAVGGTYRAGPTPAGGWSVQVTVPLDPNASAKTGDHAILLRPPRDVTARRWPVGIMTGVLLAILEVEVVLSAQRHGPLALNAAVIAAAAAALLLLPRRPMLFLIVVQLLAIPLSGGLTAVDATTIMSVYVMIVPLIVVAVLSDAAQMMIGLVIVVAVEVGTGIFHHVAATDLIGSVLVSIAICAVGRVIRSQRLLSQSLRQAASDLASERVHRERLVVAGELTRIVRALDWRVTDDIAAMLIQAEVACEHLSIDPPTALVAIATLESSGRDTLAEMRRILGLLRTEAVSAADTLAPGLDKIPLLIQAARDRSLDVALTVAGEPGPLLGGGDVTTYRIIEDVLAHIDSPGSQVSIHLVFEAHEVRIDIDVTGRPPEVWPPAMVHDLVAACRGEIRSVQADLAATRLVVALPRQLAVNSV